MSERANFRGGRGASRRGGDARGARGGGGGGRGGAQQAEKPKKENILDLTKYMDKQITVKFNGGREGWSHRLDSWWERVFGGKVALTGLVRHSGGNVERIRPADESRVG